MTPTAAKAFELYMGAYDAGAAYAQSIKAGDRFEGAKPAAIAAGYLDLARQRCFIAGALDTFQSMVIRTDAAGIVLPTSTLKGTK